MPFFEQNRPGFRGIPLTVCPSKEAVGQPKERLHLFRLELACVAFAFFVVVHPSRSHRHHRPCRMAGP